MDLQARWTIEAKSQFKEILDYWNERNGSTVYSEKLVGLVDQVISVLLKFPKVGRVTENERIRLKIIKDYFLYYSFNDSMLTVLGISDMRRDPQYLRSLLV